MADVVILALNSGYVHSALAPWYLKAAAGDLPLSLEVIEHTVNESVRTVVEDIVKRSPRLLAISVYIWNVQVVRDLAALIKNGCRTLFWQSAARRSATIPPMF